jgi:hypothetical protein
LNQIAAERLRNEVQQRRINDAASTAAGWFALLMLGWGVRRNRRNSRA